MAATEDLGPVLGVDSVRGPRGWYTLVPGGDTLARVIGLVDLRGIAKAASRIGISPTVLRRIVAGLAISGNTLRAIASWISRDAGASRASFVTRLV
jgi:hypothetical protein